MDRRSWMNAVRQPASAAVAGLVFAVILGGVIALLHGAAPTIADADTGWARDAGRRDTVDLALNLIPFAGIAFVWFIAVIRAQLGSREDRFFETVFLGSGLLFVASLFTAAAALKGALVAIGAGVDIPIASLTLTWTFASASLALFGARMAAVFILSVTTMGMRTGTVPRWLGFTGYALAVLLVLTPPLPNLAQFAFPVWVALVSLHILVVRRRATV